MAGRDERRGKYLVMATICISQIWLCCDLTELAG
jgi:hypothetical protein